MLLPFFPPWRIIVENLVACIWILSFGFCFRTMIVSYWEHSLRGSFVSLVSFFRQLWEILFHVSPLESSQKPREIKTPLWLICFLKYVLLLIRWMKLEPIIQSEVSQKKKKKTSIQYTSTLAWRIPGTGEPGGLPSMGSHRVRHDWSDLATAAAMHIYGI